MTAHALAWWRDRRCPDCVTGARGVKRGYKGGPLTVALAAPRLIDRGSHAGSPCCVGKLMELRNAER